MRVHRLDSCHRLKPPAATTQNASPPCLAHQLQKCDLTLSFSHQEREINMVRQVAIIRFGALFALLLVACAEGYDPSLDDDARAINDQLEQKVRGVDDAVTRITKTKLFKCGDLRRQGQTFKCRGWRNRIPSLLLVGSGILIFLYNYLLFPI